MRLILTARGRTIVDLEVLPEKKQPDNDGPRLEAAGFLADSGRAEPMAPDTTVFGFTQRPQS